MTTAEYGYEKVPQAAGTHNEEEELTAKFDAANGGITIRAPAMTSTTSSTNSRTFLYVAACAGNLAAFTCGTAFGWTSPEIPKLKSTTSDNPLSEAITKNQESWIGSLIAVGAGFGPLAAGIAADKIGRKKTILIGIVPFIIAFLLSAYATTPNAFFIARFLCGLGVGFVFTVLPMYIGEISDDEVRGSLGSFMQLFITVGLLFSFIIGPYTSVKFFNLVCVIIPSIFLVIFHVFIPESPYYLIQSSDRASAEIALMKLRSQSRSDVQKELAAITSAVEEDVANKGSFMDIFKSRGLIKALIISVGLVSLQQFSGINIVLFFAQDIFTDAGSTIAPEISTIIIGIVQVLASAATPLLVDRKGKRFLLLVSAVGMALSQGALGYFFHLKHGGQDVSSLAWLPVVSLISYIITYCLGFGPLPWAVMGELFPGNVKSAASTITTVSCWALGFLITQYYGVVSAAIGVSGSFGIFGVCCVAAAIFVFKFVPETSGRSLQEIQDILNGIKAVPVTKTADPTMSTKH